MQSPFDNFEEIVCINLEQRTDRWQRSLEEFARLGIAGRVIRFPAVTPRDGNAIKGCMLSHLRILRDARARGVESVLVFEDDVEFAPRARETMAAAVSELRQIDWQLLYLGIDLIEPPTRVSAHLLRSYGGHDSHAYAAHRSVFDFILERTSLDESQLHRGYDDAIDTFYAEQVHPYLRCLCVSPMVCRQRPGYSDIERREVEYSHASRNFRKMARKARLEPGVPRPPGLSPWRWLMATVTGRRSER